MKFVLMALSMLLGASASAYSLPANKNGFVCSTDSGINIRYMGIAIKDLSMSLELSNGARELKVYKDVNGKTVKANGEFRKVESLGNSVLTLSIWNDNGGSFELYALPKTVKFDERSRKVSFKAKANALFVSENFLHYGMSANCVGKM